MTFSEAQDALLNLYEQDGFINWDGYQQIVDNLNAKDNFDFDMWLMASNIPMKRLPPKPRDMSRYQKRIKRMVKNPNVRQMLKKRKGSGDHIARAIRMLTAQRLDEEKRMLEDAIRQRQSQIPNWKSWLEKIRKSLDFSDLRDIWEQLKSIPAFACLYGDRDMRGLFTN